MSPALDTFFKYQVIFKMHSRVGMNHDCLLVPFQRITSPWLTGYCFKSALSLGPGSFPRRRLSDRVW
jgi:hypothetical protein